MDASSSKQQPNAKRPRTEIEPTVLFTVEDDDEHIIATKAFSKCPKFVHVGDPRWNATFEETNHGKLVILEHAEMNWIMVVNSGPKEKVGSIFTKGLPHAMPKHFMHVRLDDHEVDWNQVTTLNAVQNFVSDPA